MLPARLDYLFTARFKDGTVYHQLPSDRSLTEPLTRSAFWDIEQRMAEVASFTLSSGRREHTVFLADGHFLTDGCDLPNPYGELTGYRVKYFRRVHQHIVMQGGKRTETKQPEIVGYYLGWTAKNARGKELEMVLEIQPPSSLRRAALSG